MTTFKQAALKPNATHTTNGMPALDKTGSTLVDLFFAAGASRNNPDNFVNLFAKAFNYADKTYAMRILFWTRDVRGGAGERKVFREALKFLERGYSKELAQVLHFVPEYGRWDDLLIFQTPVIKKKAFEIIAQALQQENGLAAKWMPRKGEVAVELREYMHLSPKQYRKTLVRLTNVVEQDMCAQKWDHINFEHVPSIAAKAYQNAFVRHCGEAYQEYVQKLSTGEAKINAKAIFPHDVLVGMNRGNTETAIAQWDALPNFLGDDKILPLVDTSGSMDTPAGTSSVTCMDIAIALGLYLADKQTGDFSDMFINFSESPRLNVLSGNIWAKYQQLQRAEWGYNTNIEKVFNLILAHAKKHNVADADMPKYLLILSDMQFDQACRGANLTAFELLRQKYEVAGYTMPKVIFWNLNASYGNVPVKFDEMGTAMVSGYAPAILKTILKSPDALSPINIVMDVVLSERYSPIVVE